MLCKFGGVLFSVFLFSASSAYAGSVVASIENYCVRGTGDNTLWGWRVFQKSTTTPISGCTGATSVANGVPAVDIVTELISVINGCNSVVTARIGPSCGSDPGMTIESLIVDFDLALESKTTPGTYPIVTPGSPVEFNPYCYVPEPSSGLLIGAGVCGLFGLARRREIFRRE